MILQALTEYYERKSKETDSSIPEFGWEFKEISFVLVLDENGVLLNIEDFREIEGKQHRGKMFKVPIAEIRTGKNYKANTLWDNPGYIFGLGKSGKEKRSSFLEKNKRLFNETPSVAPIIKFLESLDLKKMENFDNWGDIEKSDSKYYISFKILNREGLIFEYPEVKEAVNSEYIGRFSTSPEGICLVTGKKTRIKELHKEVKGVIGASPSGAKLVSYNWDSALSFQSDGIEDMIKTLNCSVGIKAEFAYTTALNILLSQNSKQKFSFSDSMTIVFWSEKSTDLENSFSEIFDYQEDDNPDREIEKVRKTFTSVYTDKKAEYESSLKFYLLGLDSSKSRIIIRLWQVSTIEEIGKIVIQYFEDFSIATEKSKQKFYSIKEVVRNVSWVNKAEEEIDTNLLSALLMSVLNGTKYPEILLQATMRRILNDSSGIRVNSVRAATLRAYLNSYYRSYERNKFTAIGMKLDENQQSMAYQLGRLFAALEYVQRRASPEINSTITEKFYASACSTPVYVFPTLLRLKSYNMAKIEEINTKIYLENVIGEIMDNIQSFPKRLDINEQGIFSIGYYHQRTFFYTPNESKQSSRDLNKSQEQTVNKNE